MFSVIITLLSWSAQVDTNPMRHLSELRPPTHTDTEFRHLIGKLDRYNELQQELMGIPEDVYEQMQNVEHIDKIIEETPDQLPYLFEGDIVLTEEQADELIDDIKEEVHEMKQAKQERQPVKKKTKLKRNLSIPKYKWIQFPIRYYINMTTKVNEKAVLRGIAAWEQETCIRFQRVSDQDIENSECELQKMIETCLQIVLGAENLIYFDENDLLVSQNDTTSYEATNSEEDVAEESKCSLPEGKPYHIEFVKGTGCYSSIGNVSRNGQVISIGNGCTLLGTVTHEIGHSLGLIHEQARPDRDDFVTILVDNIRKGYIGQFARRSWKSLLKYGLNYEANYDYGSVMHYSATAFKAGQTTTIETNDKNYQNTIGQRGFGPSFTDIRKVNEAYCNEVCHQQLSCENGGYTDPKNCSVCRCPDGFGGMLCNFGADSAPECGEINLNATDQLQQIQMKGTGTCNYFIKAPPDHVVHFELANVCFPTKQICTKPSLEIKYSGDMSRAGARLCKSFPTSDRSAADRVMVIYRGAKNTQFSMGFRAKNPDEPVASLLSDEATVENCEIVSTVATKTSPTSNRASSNAYATTSQVEIDNNVINESTSPTLVTEVTTTTTQTLNSYPLERMFVKMWHLESATSTPKTVASPPETHKNSYFLRRGNTTIQDKSDRNNEPTEDTGQDGDLIQLLRAAKVDV